MKKNLLYQVAALGACLAAGCAMHGPRDANADPPPGTGVKCKADANKNCAIPVTVDPASCAEKDIKLEEDVALSRDAAEDKFVVWTLSKGYVFCQKDNDGAILKPDSPGNGAFTSVGDPGCTSTFRWKRDKVDGLAYRYKLVFRSEDGKRQCVKDPWVRNG
jgi:hypothetical protein